MPLGDDLAEALRQGMHSAKDDVERRLIAGVGRMRRLIAERTPVLTGRARASWNASVGSPDTTVKTNRYYNPSLAVFDGNEDLVGFELGQDIHITNDLPYIKRLNSGSSTQAPAGFVELAIEEAEDGLITE